MARRKKRRWDAVPSESRRRLSCVFTVRSKSPNSARENTGENAVVGAESALVLHGAVDDDEEEEDDDDEEEEYEDAIFVDPFPVDR